MTVLRVSARIPSTTRLVTLGLCAGALALPAVAAGAHGATGGAAAPGGAAAGPSAPAGSAATSGALTVTPASLLLGDTAIVSGSVGAAGGGAPVWLQVQRARRGWKSVATALAAPDGSFVISWRTTIAGQLTLRAFSAAGTPKPAQATTSALTRTPIAALSVYERVISTWYGPGLYGRHTACGEILTAHIVGVAERTLPCGTPVSITYNGHTLIVPVIDRGPYTSGVTLDLTHAAAQELGVTGTVGVGMLALAGPPLAPSSWYAPGSAPAGSSGSRAPTANAGGATAPSA